MKLFNRIRSKSNASTSGEVSVTGTKNENVIEPELEPSVTATPESDTADVSKRDEAEGLIKAETSPYLCGIIPYSTHEESEVAKEVVDSDAINLSYVGQAAYESLRFKNAWYHHRLWNVTSGKVIGELHQTPKKEVFTRSLDPEEMHDDWFPEKMYDIMIKTKVWCDVMSLGPPDGVFFDKIKEALKVISDNNADAEKPVIIRIMLGNIIGMPVNCNAIIAQLTDHLPSDTKIRLWLGAWRKGASWNHAKFIAVDGRYLHTGGHNLWDYHYLKNNPVHDLSLEMEGRVTLDAHRYANEQWDFIRQKQDTVIGQCADKIPDSMPVLWTNRVTISEYPLSVADEFPPRFEKDSAPNYDPIQGAVPVISIGRGGCLQWKARPSDDAIIAMIDSAKTIIRLSLQDIGPVCIPNTKTALPGCTWPKNYLNALARAIWTKGVDVEIVLSNPGSIPGGLGPLDACYGNGWSCVDVASELIKRIKKQYPFARDSELRKKVEENLRICFIRHAGSRTYADGGNIGLHSKFFIVDDICSYTGSQNLYVCDLAEWGVIVDNTEETTKMIESYWNPLWQASYTGEDCDVQAVMDGLDIDRDGETVNYLSPTAAMAQMEAAAQAGAMKGNSSSTLYSKDKPDE